MEISDIEYSLDVSFSLSNEGGGACNEADSVGEEILDKDMKELLSMMKKFNPYM